MDARKELWIWVGGAAMVVLVVVLWLVLSAPEPILPATYNFGYQ